jgi:hypothetical protein
MCFQLVLYRLLIVALGTGFFDLPLYRISSLNASLDLFWDRSSAFIICLCKIRDLFVQHAADCPREPYLQFEDPLW